jgi:ribitol-5-phosphate 2-dehydrogenase (NADP+)
MNDRAVPATVYRLTRPFRIEPFQETTGPLRAGFVRLRPLRTGICGSDLKLYSGTRARGALATKLPMALLHEGVAEVTAVGDGAPFQVGQHVVPLPNIPCTIADGDRSRGPAEACHACRPGGAGANYCLAGRFLGSNVDGLARTALVHPAACTIPVPVGVPDTLAVLVEPMATVLAGLDQVPLPAGGRFLVLGNGTMGILTVIALRAVAKAAAGDVLMTGHGWDTRAASVEGLATPVEDGEGDVPGRAAAAGVDVAFECVGGDAASETIALAIEALRPGGRGVLFGPSERPLLFDVRKMIAKGLTFVGCNRARVEHFAQALELCRQPALWPSLERALGSKEFVVQAARDLDEAFYHAWTKAEAGRTVVTW